MKPAQRQKSIDNNVPSLERLKDSPHEHSVVEQPYSTHTSAWRRQPIVNIKRRSDKEDIQMEIEYNMKCIQKQATLFCHINEEWMTIKDELAVVKKKFDGESQSNQDETRNTINKVNTLQREFRNLAQQTSIAGSEVEQLKWAIEDHRRVIGHYTRHKKNSNTRSTSHQRSVQSIETQVVQSRQAVSNLLIGYKRGLHESINLRRAIQSELTINSRRVSKIPAMPIPDIKTFMVTMERYEIESRDLLKHSIMMNILRNRHHTDLINKYILKMEEFDHAFNKIKERESVTDISEILQSLERNQVAMDLLQSKMYQIENEVKRYEGQN
jgi:hypothetical protein